MKTPPPNWPRISSSVCYRDASTAIAWLCEAFGFELRLRVEDDDGRIVHSELSFGEGLVMVSGEGASAKRSWRRSFRSPASLDGRFTQAMMVFVDDVDASCARARGRGARIVEEPATHDHGEDYWTDRSYAALDPEGHLWWFTQRLRDPVTR